MNDKILNEENKINLLDQFIRIDSIEKLWGKIANQIIDTIKNDPKALIGLSSQLDLKNIFINVKKNGSEIDFRKVDFALLSEKIKLNEESYFSTFAPILFDEIGVEKEHILKPIKSFDYNDANREIAKFNRSINKRDNFNLVVIHYDSTNKQIELLNSDNLKDNYLRQSFTWINGEAQLACVGTKEIIDAKKIILIAHNNNDLIDIKKLFLTNSFEPNFALSFLHNVLEKIVVYSLVDFELKKQSEEIKIEERKELIDKIRETDPLIKKIKDMKIQAEKNESKTSIRENSVFYDDEFLLDKDKLKAYQHELRQKVFMAKEQSVIPKNARSMHLERKQKEDTIRLSAKVIELESNNNDENK